MRSLPVPPRWGSAINDWSVALRAAGRSNQTIETRAEHLRRLARKCGAPAPGLLTRKALTAWVGSQEWAAETRRSTYASIRGFYRWALAEGVVADDIADCLPSTKPGVPCPTPIGEASYRRALSEARLDPRAHCALRLAGEAGLRRAEIVLISRPDLFEDLLGWSIVVHGKGGKQRIVPLTDSLAAEIRGLLGEHTYLMRSSWTGKPLTPRALAKLGAAYLPEGVGLHKLRHRFAATVNRQTKDLRSLQVLLGHASLATTQRYVPVDVDQLRVVVNAAAS